MIAVTLFILLFALPPDSENSILEFRAESQKHSSFISDSTDHKKVSWLVLPIIFKSPDTGIALGILPQVVFRTNSANNPSNIRLDTYYTQQNQYHLLLRSGLWLSDDKLNLNSSISFKKWPTYYYGIGNRFNLPEKELFTEELYEAYFEGTKQVKNQLYLGLGYKIRYGKISVEDDGGLLQYILAAESPVTFISGINTTLKFDSRDHHFYPSRGAYNQFTIYSSLKSIGSDFSFGLLTLDFRRYIPLFRSHVLALQGVGMITLGSIVPFRMLPSLGSQLRGYSSVRHIDRRLVALQAEYRVVPVGWRIGFTVFGGVGEVFNKFEDIHMNRLKYTAGIGLRYIFSREEKINIRFDYGMGRESSGDYIDLNEAF
jgi:outer membrane protein assembly factor BamA